MNTKRFRPTLTLAILLLALLTPASGARSQDKKKCDDPVPKDCAKAKFLGEDSQGCACFICNPDGPTRKGVCTNQVNDKKTLYTLSGQK